MNLHTRGSAYQKWPTWSSHLAPEVHQRNPWILSIFSLRIDREQHVPDSSNHSIYLMKPAVRWFCLSFAAKPEYNERFARQYCYSTRFLLTLRFSSFVHHLSDPKTRIHTYKDTHAHTYSHIYIIHT